MGRVYMKDFGTAGLDRFVSLGSPHNPPPKDVPGVIDQTRGILTWVEDNCPGAFEQNVRTGMQADGFSRSSLATYTNCWRFSLDALTC